VLVHHSEVSLWFAVDLQEMDRQVPLMDEIDSKVINEINGLPRA